MSTFLQLHILTSYPPSNLNRDDLGRPKQAKMGGTDRLRISSQSLKRAWRESSVFEDAVKGNKGIRTKNMGVQIYTKLKEAGINEKIGHETAKLIAGKFGACKKPDSKNPLVELEIEQLAHFSPEEVAAIGSLVEKVKSTGKVPEVNELDLLRKDHSAVDIALFGRMLASSPGYNVEAAAQVAHAITVHSVAVEDDYFTAIDDLNKGNEETGAAHIGETEFAAGLYYLYICVNRDLLEESLSGNTALSKKGLAAFIEAALTVAPKGKQNSFASRARASYVLAEKGPQQPRSLSVAFLEPVGGNMLNGSILSLQKTFKNMDEVYGPCCEKRYEMNAYAGTGSLKELLTFAVE